MRFCDWLTELTYDVLQGDILQEVDEVVYDSRKAKKGCVFVCMKGTKTDSHQFIPDVAARGVTAVVVEEDVPIPEGMTAVRWRMPGMPWPSCQPHVSDGR